MNIEQKLIREMERRGRRVYWRVKVEEFISLAFIFVMVLGIFLMIAEFTGLTDWFIQLFV